MLNKAAPLTITYNKSYVDDFQPLLFICHKNDAGA